MKNIFLIVTLIICSQVSFSQEWVSYNFTFKFSDIENRNEINNVSFKYIDGAKININPIIFDIQKKEFNISFETMGIIPILVLEKENETMYIFLKRKPVNPDKIKYRDNNYIITSKFMKGYYKPNDSELIEWNNREKYAEWIRSSDIKPLELKYLDGK